MRIERNVQTTFPLADGGGAAVRSGAAWLWSMTSLVWESSGRMTE
jgi:hypothetical protein